MLNLKLQNIPPKQAHLCLEICHFLEEIDFSLASKKCIIALSGGADSTALLLFLYLLKEKYKLELYAVHIDHSLRPESTTEAQHVKDLCQKLAVPCECIKEDVYALSQKWKKGTEETARIVRYTHFERIRKEKSFDIIALGHHLNDLAEDSLMRQIRGTSLDQSIGMTAIDEKRFLIRPFLLTERKILEDFLLACKLTWLSDSSNMSDIYLRNRVRHNILPLFLKENPSYLKNIRTNWLQGQSDKAYWQKKIAPYIPQEKVDEGKTFSLSRKDISQEEKALRLRVFAEILRFFESQPLAKNLFLLDALVIAKESNKKLHINNKLLVSVNRTHIVFENI